MKNIKTYLKKNGFFVFLLTVILLIIIALSVYIFVNTQAQQEPVKPVVTTPEPAPAKTTAEITQFEGEYRKDLRYIDVTWSSIVSGEIKYIGTQTKTRDGSVYAETTYQINWPEAVVTYQQFDVRWSFKDIQYSKDFLAEKGKAVEQATE